MLRSSSSVPESAGGAAPCRNNGDILDNEVDPTSQTQVWIALNLIVRFNTY
jgi:hypothetical protein